MASQSASRKTEPGESAALDELVAEMHRWIDDEPVPNDVVRHLEELIRRAFKLALDTELEAMEDIALSNLAGLKVKALDLARAVDSASSWIRPRKPDDAPSRHQVPPT